MSQSNTRALACSQHDAAQILAAFPPQVPAALDLQARKLHQRFALAPEMARTIAGLAFAAEARE